MHKHRNDYGQEEDDSERYIIRKADQQLHLVEKRADASEQTLPGHC